MTPAVREAAQRLIKERLIPDGRSYCRESLPSAVRNAAAELALRAEWAELESAGLVRIRWEHDESASYEDLAGDCFKPDGPSCNLRALKAEEKRFKRQIEREGVWGRVAQFRPTLALPWESGGSCWGFVGQDSHDIESDIMSETLEELKKAQAALCPCCKGTGRVGK